MKNLIAILSAAAFLVFASMHSAQSGGLPYGEAEFRVDAPRGPVTVYTCKPQDFGPHSPVWIIMHGVGHRNDALAPSVAAIFARAHGLRLSNAER